MPGLGHDLTIFSKLSPAAVYAQLPDPLFNELKSALSSPGGACLVAAASSPPFCNAGVPLGLHPELPAPSEDLVPQGGYLAGQTRQLSASGQHCLAQYQYFSKPAALYFMDRNAFTQSALLPSNKSLQTTSRGAENVKSYVCPLYCQPSI